MTIISNIAATGCVATVCNLFYVLIDLADPKVNQCLLFMSKRFPAVYVTSILPATVATLIAKPLIQKFFDNKYISYIGMAMGGCSANYLLNKLCDDLDLLNHLKHSSHGAACDQDYKITMGHTPNKCFLNTLAQTVLIDMIWNGFPWSNDEAQDLSEIEDITQDDYYNEYVMAAAA